jgi:uncharacterized protein
VIGYVDTSAFVPLLIAESSSTACRRFWDDADVVVSCRLLYVETAAALAQASRMGRLSTSGHDAALEMLEGLWPQVEVVEADEALVVRAAVLAHQQGLRGYDAVHCAAVEQINDDDVVAAAGDRPLLSAWAEIGVATYDTNGASGGD